MPFTSSTQQLLAYLEAALEGLRELRAWLLGEEEPQLLQESAADDAAAGEAAGSTAGWAGESPFALNPPEKSAVDRWTWPPRVASLCGWETPSCKGVQVEERGGLFEEDEEVQ